MAGAAQHPAGAVLNPDTDLVANRSGYRLLECFDLVKDYPGKRAVDGVDFHVMPGEIVGLLGPNGAGKTTTFRMACGMISPTEGEVFLNGADVTQWPMYRRAQHGMGYLPQEPELDPTLEPGRDLLVVRHDAITPAQADGLDDGRGPTHVIISPGPCTPREAGVSSDIIAHFAGRVPVLGVCLGHQCMADINGMVVERHPLLMHGKTSSIVHDGRGVFEGVRTPTVVARYHSLIVRRDSVPSLQLGSDGWEVSASCFDEIDGQRVEVVMGLRRVWADPGLQPLEGVQFHPESFMTPEGGRSSCPTPRAQHRDRSAASGVKNRPIADKVEPCFTPPQRLSSIPPSPAARSSMCSMPTISARPA